MTRKQFIEGLAGGSVMLLFSGCGGGGGYGGTSMPAGTTGCSETIATNHGHVLTVPLADLNSTVDKTYDIQGTAGHTHTVTLTAAQLAQLKAGQAVNVNSSTSDSTVYGMHFHAVSVSCAM